MIADPKSPVCRKPAGGVAAVELTAAANVRDVRFDTAGLCSQLDLADEQAVMQCELLEERSSLVETLSAEGGAVAVNHRLQLVADRNLAHAWLQPEFVAEALRRGVVAVVTLADGRRLLAGASSKFGLEQPLRLKTLKVASGTRALEAPTVELALESSDTAFAAQMFN